MKKVFSLFVLLLILSACGGESEETTEETTEETIEEEAGEETEATEEEVTEEEQQAYEDEAKPFIEETIEEFDRIWEEGWRPTMSAVSEGGIDEAEAIENIQQVADDYDALAMQLYDVSAPDDFNQDQSGIFHDFIAQVQLASVSRQDAAQKFVDDANAGIISDETILEIESFVEESDGHIQRTAVERETLESMFE